MWISTVSVATGHNEYWPLYASIGNIHNNIRRAHGAGLVLVGFLAIPKGRVSLHFCDYVWQISCQRTETKHQILLSVAFDVSSFICPCRKFFHHSILVWRNQTLFSVLMAITDVSSGVWALTLQTIQNKHYWHALYRTGVHGEPNQHYEVPKLMYI